MFSQNINAATLKVLATPIVIIILTLVLLLVSGRTIFGNITNELDQIKDTQSKVAILEQKVEILKVFDSKIAGNKSDITYLVLPDSNPVAVAILQTKSTLAQKGVTEINDIEFRGGEKINDLQSAQVSLMFETLDLASLTDFLNTFQKLAPITTLDEVKVGSTTNSPIEVEMTFSTYWSKLPEKLPSLGQVVSDLTPEEAEALNNILSFTLPSFSVDSEPQTSPDRLNPFN